MRSTLTRRLIDEPCAEGGRLAYQLTYYWYFRERLVETTRWLQLGHQATQGDSTESLLARVPLAMVLTLQRRLDLARPHLNGLEADVRDAPSHRLVDIGGKLVGLAMSMYVCEDPLLLRDLHQLLGWVVGETADANLALLADAVSCCALLLLGQVEAAVAFSTSVQDPETSPNLTAL